MLGGHNRATIVVAQKWSTRSTHHIYLYIVVSFRTCVVIQAAVAVVLLRQGHAIILRLVTQFIQQLVITISFASACKMIQFEEGHVCLVVWYIIGIYTLITDDRYQAMVVDIVEVGATWCGVSCIEHVFISIVQGRLHCMMVRTHHSYGQW